MKPGYKTTEFWMLLALSLIGIGADIAAHWQTHAGAVLAGILSAGYTLSRLLLKSGGHAAQAEFLGFLQILGKGAAVLAA